MKRYPKHGAGCLFTVDVTLLALVRPPFDALARALDAPHAWIARAGVDGASMALAAAALWLAAAWIALGLLAGLAGQLPGALGRAAEAASRVLLPRILLRLVAGSAGLGVLLTPVAAGAAPSAAPGPASHAVGAVPVPTPTWPVEGAASPSVPAPRWPSGVAPRAHPQPVHPPAASDAPRAHPQPVHPPAASDAPRARPLPVHPPTASGAPATARRLRVRTGDSLWLIAARRLGPHPAPERVAAQWPRWYAANRAVIGDDPALILPGQVLTAPNTAAPDTRQARR